MSRDKPVCHTYTSDLSALRSLVEKQAREANLPDIKVMDLVLAVSEVAASTMWHARSPGTVDISHDDHEVVCTIRDNARIADPFAGGHPDAGPGDWLRIVRQVCDRVELDSDTSGRTIRLHMTIPCR